MEVGIRNDLVFGTVSANDFGIYISGEGVYNAPERVVELLDVPGRNGALTIDMGHYGNITIEYPAFTFADSQTEFRRKLNAYKNAIMAQVGYQKLSDTYHPDEYRLGMFVEGLDVEPVGYGRSGSFTLRFNCKPQRYLSSGQQPIEVNDGDVVVNPTLYDAEPLLKVKGYGNISFNGYTIELEDGSIGTVNLWQGTSYSKRTSQALSITATKTFDDSLFEANDSFSFDVQQSIDIYDEVASSTKTNANATNTDSDNNDGSVRLATTLHCTFAVGTSNTIGNTSVFTLVSTETLTAVMSVAYDGVGTVTFTTTYTATDPSSLGINMNEYIGGCTAASSLTILGNPTYIDCEIGEAYKFVGTSPIGLNAYIDLGSDLPKLSPGANTFEMDNTITDLQIVTRWWEL